MKQLPFILLLLVITGCQTQPKAPPPPPPSPEALKADYEKHIQLARANNIDSMQKVAVFYEEGLGTPKNYNKACFWLKKAKNGKNWAHSKYYYDDTLNCTNSYARELNQFAEDTREQIAQRIARKGAGKRRDETSPTLKKEAAAKSQAVTTVTAEEDEECRESIKLNMAYAMIQNDVRSQLQAPASADFPWGYDRRSSRYEGNCIYRVVGHVDAQNGFGANLRARFIGRIKHFPETGVWRTIEIRILD